MARRIAVVVAMALFLGVVVWAGVRNYRARQRAMQATQTALLTLRKDSAGSEAGPGQDEPLRGKPAPAFTLKDTTGKKVSLADFKGKPVIINFWATWCLPCRLEMPWFQEFAAKYGDKGLTVLGISEDESASTEEIARAAKKSGVSYPILLRESKVTKAYGGVDFLPETFYVDRNGTVVAQTAGGPTKDQIEANIRKALGE